ncbi:thiol-disulfide oxidoreductase DCC family protein [Variovorax sp. RB2P76]|uniref:thiol-disulfide oxidoreductase DCC family protein n=1 Tax=Variovorax sp. RB2P76 TaxID=3443736 RepID=UPI003F48E53F
MNPATAPAYPLTIYFDASCAICSAEMNHMKARDAAGRLQLVDCSPAAFTAGPAPRDALMAAIHVSDAQGRVFVGVPAIRICRTAVGLSSGGFLLDLPFVAPLADRAYALLARNRYRIPRWLAARLAGRVAPSCDDGNCRL